MEHKAEGEEGSGKVEILSSSVLRWWHGGGSNFVHHTFLDILDGFLLLPWLHFTVALNGLGSSPKIQLSQ